MPAKGCERLGSKISVFYGIVIETHFGDHPPPHFHAKEVDLSELLAAGGVFAPFYQRREFLEQARVNPENGAVEWPGDVDLDPAVLCGRYERASGHHIDRRTPTSP